MIFNIFKPLFIGLVLFASTNTHAGVEQFQDSFAGYLDKSVMNDVIWFSGQSTFTNNNLSLTTTHDIFDDGESFFIVVGTFERDDGTRKFSGSFDINLYSLDPSLSPYPWLSPGIPYEIMGNFQYDHSLYSPITGERLINDYGFGLLKGYITNLEYITFTIDWMTVTGEVVSSVPAPPTAWLFGSGLCLLGLLRVKRLSQNFANTAWH